ncbi:MAG: acyl-CoA dehydrogenase family protein, partial [Betaproteobacteria bacterium]
MNAMLSPADAERVETLQMVRDSAADFAAAGSGVARARSLRFLKPGFSIEALKQMCQLGWPGLLLQEHFGGAGLGMPEFCAITEELGSVLAPEPLIELSMAAQLLAASAEQELLAQVLNGDALVLPAWQESVNVWESSPSLAFVNGKLTGVKKFVPAAGTASAFVVTTSSGLVLVQANALGLSLHVENTQDGCIVGELRFDQTPARSLSANEDAMSEALLCATLAASAYLLGVAERAFAMTLDYLRLRKQFGRAIG